jgi:DNA-binding Lrp family transcriptional regulator
MLCAMKALALDCIDRRLVHSLIVEPRAPFRTLASVVGVSDHTVARRYRQLAERASLRVAGRIDGFQVGWVNWYVRLRCVPGAAEVVAEELAQRTNTSWVVIAAGGTEIVCALQARTAAQDAVLLQGLAGSRRVQYLTAHQLLHDYSRQAWAQLTDALSAAESQRLQPRHDPDSPNTAANATGIELTSADIVLLDELAIDGRTSNTGLATATGWHESTVRRRIHELRGAGILRFDVDIDTQGFGMSTQAMLWISVEPAYLDATGRAIAGHAEVPFVAATTGPTNLIALVVCRDARHLYDYLTRRLGTLRGVRGADTSPLIRVVKRVGRVKHRTLQARS